MSAAILSQLLQLGFDIELSREALEVGHAASAEEAVEWVTLRQAGRAVEEIVQARRASQPGTASSRTAGSDADAVLRLGGARGVGISSPFAAGAAPLPMHASDVQRAIDDAEKKALDASTESPNADAGSSAGPFPPAATLAPRTAPGPSSPVAPAPASSGPQKIASRYKESKEDNRMLAERIQAEQLAKYKKTAREVG